MHRYVYLYIYLMYIFTTHAENGDTNNHNLKEHNSRISTNDIIDTPYLYVTFQLRDEQTHGKMDSWCVLKCKVTYKVYMYTL